MNDRESSFENYRIEVSGWGLDDCFFVERTDLLWTAGNDKKVLLRHALPDGAMIFVRLLGDGLPGGSVPRAYRIENLQPMNRIGLCEMRLLPLHPQEKTPAGDEIARGFGQTSEEWEDSMQDSLLAEPEEVLHEA